jgi:hypothetical protein
MVLIGINMNDDTSDETAHGDLEAMTNEEFRDWLEHVIRDEAHQVAGDG